MTTKEYSLTIDDDLKNIDITGIIPTAITINYSGDIDFTRLVKALTASIDNKSILTPKADNDTSDDSSLRLIIETIDSIIKEYNDAIKDLVGEDDEQEEIADIDEPEVSLEELL